MEEEGVGRDVVGNLERGRFEESVSEERKKKYKAKVELTPGS